MLAPLPHAAELEARWWDYELGRTAEGRWVKALDKLDMALMASLYASRDSIDPTEFVDSALARLDAPSLRALCVDPEVSR